VVFLCEHRVAYSYTVLTLEWMNVGRVNRACAAIGLFMMADLHIKFRYREYGIVN